MSNDFLDKYKSVEDNTTEKAMKNSAKKVAPKMKNTAHVEEDLDMQYVQTSDFQPPKQVNTSAPIMKKPYKKYGIIGATILLIIILCYIIFQLFFGATTVPDMIGWKESDATLWATENKVMIRYMEAYDDDVALDTIMEQHPEKGEDLEKGSFLELTLSQGPDMSIEVKLPDFSKMSKKEVEKWAAQNHMSKVRITVQDSKSIEKGELISYTVNDDSVIGDDVRRDSPIYLIYSNGAGENGKVTVPDFTMMTKVQALSFATDNDILLEIEEVFDEAIEKDKVISQDIDPEEVVKVGDTIKLKVSKGPEIYVPNFASYNAEMAQAVAAKEGITVIMKERYSGYAKDRLVSQSIPTGTLYDPDEFLILTYSLGNQVDLGSFVGQGVDALNTWLAEYNEKGANIRTSITYTVSNEAPGSILTQSPQNKSIGISQTISLVVSKGDVVYMPDLVAAEGASYADIITREKAIAICAEVGIVPIFQEEVKEGRLPGEVWSQSVEAGIEVQQGSSVTLYYTPNTTTEVVPDFNGMTKAQIEANGYHKKFSLSYSSSDANTVYKNQSVPAGSTVAAGTEIQLSEDEIMVPDPEPNSPDEMVK